MLLYPPNLCVNSALGMVGPKIASVGYPIEKFKLCFTIDCDLNAITPGKIQIFFKQTNIWDLILRL